jgi:hypothetical protein
MKPSRRLANIGKMKWEVVFVIEPDNTREGQIKTGQAERALTQLGLLTGRQTN